MANETKFGSSSGTPEGMTCNEFDALIADAIDGMLTPETLQRFQRHSSTCGNCGPLFGEVRQGLQWLESLEEIEPPANLVHNVLALTSRAESSSIAIDGKKQKGRWPFLNFAYFPQFGRMHIFGQSGLLATVGMAFFSVSLLLNVAGFSPKDLRRIDLRPSAIRKEVVQQYYAASARFVRYYKNTRFVYEVESKLRELRRAAGVNDETPKPEPKPADKTLNQPQYDDPAIGFNRNSGDGFPDSRRDSRNSLLPSGSAPQSLQALDESKEIVRRFV